MIRTFPWSGTWRLQRPIDWASLTPWLAFSLAFLLYYCALALRHAWLQTSSWDLGIFHQAIHLIAKGQEPEVSFLGFHVLGDHGAFVLYPLGFLYELFPSVQLLFVLQSAALAAAVFPFYALGVRRGLPIGLNAASLALLLLYPVVFNSAIFDFHPETLAFPLIAQVILLIEEPRRGSTFGIVMLLLLALTCKEVLAILVIGLASWLAWRRRPRLAAVLLFLGVAWLLVVGLVVVPAFGGEAASLSKHFDRFGLERTGPDPGALAMALQLFTSLTGNLIAWANLEYLVLLLVPVLWLPFHRDRWTLLAGLIPFAPLMLINLLADVSSMKNLVHHYSLFIVPLLVNQFQLTLASGPSGLAGYPYWLRRNILPVSVSWMIVSFLVLSRFGAFFGDFQSSLDNASQARQAIRLVDPQASLLATNALAAQLADRRHVEISQESTLARLDQFDQVLLDRRHPGFLASISLIDRLLQRLHHDPAWQTVFSDQDIHLLRRSRPASPVQP